MKDCFLGQAIENRMEKTLCTSSDLLVLQLGLMLHLPWTFGLQTPNQADTLSCQYQQGSPRLSVSTRKSQAVSLWLFWSPQKSTQSWPFQRLSKRTREWKVFGTILSVPRLRAKLSMIGQESLPASSSSQRKKENCEVVCFWIASWCLKSIFGWMSQTVK